MATVRERLESALAHLSLDDELDRLANPRHTDHDRHVYLPKKVADQIAAARREIHVANAQLQVDDLAASHSLAGVRSRLSRAEELLDRIVQPQRTYDTPTRNAGLARDELAAARTAIQRALDALPPE